MLAHKKKDKFLNLSPNNFLKKLVQKKKAFKNIKTVKGMELNIKKLLDLFKFFSKIENFIFLLLFRKSQEMTNSQNRK